VKSITYEAMRVTYQSGDQMARAMFAFAAAMAERNAELEEAFAARPVGAAPAPVKLAAHLVDVELYPSDGEIADEIVRPVLAIFREQWGMDEKQARARMSCFDWTTVAATGEVVA
jgi:hypothetical protein